MAAQVHVLPQPLTGHAFNGDRSQVVVGENGNEAFIYSLPGLKLQHTLKEHDKLITSLDWAPHSNRIVTCSQDRNAYVWNQSQDGTWKPTLVLLRINRAATAVRWSPNETKFAVASGARTIAVCSYEEESNWWIAKHIKKPLKSTVLSIDWHPNGVLLAAGSADSKARVFSAFLKGDDKPPPSEWGTKFPFNTLCGEYASPAGGWVHGVAFSPAGDCLAFTSHDSTINVVYPAGPDQPPAGFFTVRVDSLPFMSLTWVTPDSFVAAGHDCQPVLFKGNAQGWAAGRSLDDPASRSSSQAAPSRTFGSVGRLNNEAFNRFKAADSRGVGAVPASSLGTDSPPGSPVSRQNATERMTVHQNTITTIRPYAGQPGAITQVSTSAVDGKLVIWNV